MTQTGTAMRRRERAAEPKWETVLRGEWRLRFLPPFRRFRGCELPWDNLGELALDAERIVKSSRSRKVVKLSAGQFGTPVELYVKRYNFKTWYGPLLRSARRSRAKEEFDLGWKLIAKGVRTPRPVWLAESRGLLAPYSILATEALPEVETMVERWRRLTTNDERCELLTALGRFAYNIHALGFYHDDFKAEHVLVFPNARSDPNEFYLIDLLGGGFSHRVPKLRRAKNLYQLLRSFMPKRGDLGFTTRHRDCLLAGYAEFPTQAVAWRRRVNRVGLLKGRKLVPAESGSADDGMEE
jgi:tRNA A-37 threonylcarbamoyl transferase component Bud32